MQLFIDNWSASLLAPASADAVVLSVEPSLAALLVGLGGGDFYELTLIEGGEEGWEVVTATGLAAGEISVTRGAGARAWAAGTAIEARLTAAALRKLQGNAYLDRATYLDQVRAGALGSIRPAMLCAHPEFGAFVSVEGQLLLPWLGSAAHSGNMEGTVCVDGVLFGVEADSGSSYGWRRIDGALGLTTGDSTDAAVSLGAEVETGIAFSDVASAEVSITFGTPGALSTSAQKYQIAGWLALPGLGPLSFSYQHDQNGGMWRLTLWSPALGNVVINTDAEVFSGSTVAIAMAVVGADVNFSIDGFVVASRTVAQMQHPANGALGASVRVVKRAGAAEVFLSLGEVHGEVALV